MGKTSLFENGVMKILVFEYISGGGFNRQALPESLVAEGCLMLNAMLDCFSRLDQVELVIMLDWRLGDRINTGGVNTVMVKPEHEVMAEFERLIEQVDAVWPVAPEFDGILESLCEKAESMHRTLLTSPASAVAMTGDKFKTFEQLSRHQITTVDTRLVQGSLFEPGEWMMKPVDGAGATDSFLLTNRQDFARLSERLSDSGRYIIQPHLQGEKTSLSCLFKQGRGWLLCVNLQQFELIDKHYHLLEIVVNHDAESSRYESLLSAIAEAFPDLWGYVGIDLIETPDEIKVLEINPRLTSSFAGIREALGINCCGCVLDLLNGDPVLEVQYNRPVTIKIKQDHHAG